jgi:uncharacterized alpha-E superfamily protein
VLLGQPLALPSVQTWWCGDDTSRNHVLANLDSLAIKPVSRQMIRNSRFGWELSARQREELAHRIRADPNGWVGQEAVHPSTAPGVGPRGLEARPISLRSFAVADGGTYRVMPGGLSRVAPRTSAVVVTTRDGSLAKDVWVLSGSPTIAPEANPTDLVRGQVASAVSPRVAESLFWLGRYAERAEDVSRLVAVTDNRWHDVHPEVDPAVPITVEVLLRALLDVTAAWPTPAVIDPDPQDLMDAVIGHAEQPGTLAHDVRRVRELANASRDQLSTDTWSVFRDLDQLLVPFSGSSGSGDHGDVAAAMSSLRAALMAFAGLAAESMVRDAGWHFMDVGRRIERALQIARLLRSALASRHVASVDALVEESTLIAAESIITHRRRYPAQSGTDTVLELLLIDRDNPRSLAFQLDRLAAGLRRISPSATKEDGLHEQVLHVSARLLAADCASLAGTDQSGHRGELKEFLGTVVQELHQLAAAIEKTHFPHLGRLQPLVPIGGFESMEAV